MISPTLNVPQARFLSMPHKFKAYIAGFGSGKTWVGCGGICKGIWEHPCINQGYFAPTYPQIRDIFYPTVEEVAADWGLNVKINEGNKEVHFITDASIGEPLSADRWRSHKRSSVSKLVMRWWMNWTFCRRKSQNGVAQDNCTYAL